jgi:hypothetical protein
MTRLNNFYRRDTKVYDMTFKTSAGVAIDISLATITFTMKRRASDLTTAIQKEAVITNGPSGLATLTLTSADTDIDIGEYCYDFQYESGTGAITTLLADTLEVLQDVTITGLP